MSLGDATGDGGFHEGGSSAGTDTQSHSNQGGSNLGGASGDGGFHQGGSSAGTDTHSYSSGGYSGGAGAGGGHDFGGDARDTAHYGESGFHGGLEGSPGDGGFHMGGSSAGVDTRSNALSDFYNKAADVIRNFENPHGPWLTAHWDQTHWRIGYSSDTYVGPDGLTHEVTKDTVITAQQAEFDLQNRIKQTVARVQQQVGSTTYAQLNTNQKAALSSLAYNYGSLPSKVVNAVKSGSDAVVAAAIRSLPSSNDRRQQEASLYRTPPSPVQPGTQIAANDRPGSIPPHTGALTNPPGPDGGPPHTGAIVAPSQEGDVPTTSTPSTISPLQSFAYRIGRDLGIIKDPVQVAQEDVKKVLPYMREAAPYLPFGMGSAFQTADNAATLVSHDGGQTYSAPDFGQGGDGADFAGNSGFSSQPRQVSYMPNSGASNGGGDITGSQGSNTLTGSGGAAPPSARSTVGAVDPNTGPTAAVDASHPGSDGSSEAWLAALQSGAVSYGVAIAAVGLVILGALAMINDFTPLKNTLKATGEVLG